MRRANLSTLRLLFAPVLLVVPSCFSLPKADIIRVIDDFTSDAGTPTWTVFEPWTCDQYIPPPQDGGAGTDVAPDANADGGASVTCNLAIGTDDKALAIPPSTVTRSLVASFNLTTPSSVEVVTQAKPGPDGGDPRELGGVNLNGFSQLVFNATLLPGTSPLPSLPAGTELHVELRCASADPLTSGDLTAIILGAQAPTTVILPLSDFKGPVQFQACLATVESIRFVVVPGSALAGTEGSGILQLDQIRLE